jgi:hypothetical protein
LNLSQIKNSRQNYQKFPTAICTKPSKKDDVMFFENIFAKIWRKKTSAFENNAKISAENWQKSPKIAIIASTPGVDIPKITILQMPLVKYLENV